MARRPKPDARAHGGVQTCSEGFILYTIGDGERSVRGVRGDARGCIDRIERRGGGAGVPNGLGSMASPMRRWPFEQFLTLLILPVIPRLLTANHVGHVLVDCRSVQGPICPLAPSGPMIPWPRTLASAPGRAATLEGKSPKLSRISYPSSSKLD